MTSPHPAAETPRRPGRLAAALARGPLILDGAMGTELDARGVETSHELWSALALIEAPDTVRAVHADYLRAGAQVLTTNSYQATLPGLMRAGLNEPQARAALAASVRIARQARDAHADRRATAGGRRALVAGSIGPYGAYLADGSEYTGDYRIDGPGWREAHLPRLEALLQAGVDALAVETMPRLDEAQALIALMGRLTGRQAPPQAWVAFQVRPDGAHLADGTPLAQAGAWAQRQPEVVAVGVNCVAPEVVAPALEVLAGVTGKPLVAYPNSGDAYHPATKTWTTAPPGERFTAGAPGWLEAGARLLGGCCRTAPSDTAVLAGIIADQR